MSPNITIPVTLRPSRTKSALLFLCSAGFVVGGVSMIHYGQTTGYLCIGFFALGLPIFAVQLNPKAAYLHLAADGFTMCSLFRPFFVRWADVQEFAVIYIGLKRMVAWNFVPDYPATRRGRVMAKALAGYEAALPDTYGMKAQELADVLNNLRRQYANTRNAPA